MCTRKTFRPYNTEHLLYDHALSFLQGAPTVPVGKAGKEKNVLSPSPKEQNKADEIRGNFLKK